MKTLSTLNNNDLKIIREALGDRIAKTTTVSLNPPVGGYKDQQAYLESLNIMINQLNSNARRIAQIREIIYAINEAMNPAISEE